MFSRQCRVCQSIGVPYSVVAGDMPWPSCLVCARYKQRQNAPEKFVAPHRREPVEGGHSVGAKRGAREWCGRSEGRQERRKYKAHRFPLKWQFYCDLSHRWHFTSRYLAQLDILLCALRARHDSPRTTRTGHVLLFKMKRKLKQNARLTLRLCRSR